MGKSRLRVLSYFQLVHSIGALPSFKSLQGDTEHTMPSVPLTFRSSCGCFVAVFQIFMAKRARLKAVMRIAMLTPRTRADGAVLGLLLTLTFWGGFLMQCGDVESNPGPDRDALRQTTLTTSGGSRSRSVSAGRGSSSGSSQTTSPPLQQLSLEDLMTKLDSMENTIKSTDARTEAMESKFDSKLDEFKREFSSLREDNTSMKADLRRLREEMTGLRQQNQDLQRKNDHLTGRLDDLERMTDDLEGRSKRNNLIFYGIPRATGETSSDCEVIMRELFTDKLEFSRDVKLDRAHRLNSKQDSPIIARCVYYKQKLDILKAKQKLKGTHIFVGEDFSAKVREVRRRLTPHLKKARGDNKRATMIFNYLLIDGKRFTVDCNDRLVEVTA